MDRRYGEFLKQVPFSIYVAALFNQAIKLQIFFLRLNAVLKISIRYLQASVEQNLINPNLILFAFYR